MKKNLCFILAALLAWGGFATRAGAQNDGWYLTPKLGASLFTGDNHFDSRIGSFSKKGHSTRFAGALAAGYDFSDRGAPVRTELEFTLRSPYRTESYGEINGDPAKNKSQVDIHTLMFNAFLDFETETALTPYIGAGLGMAFIKGENTAFYTGPGGKTSRTVSHSDKKFAWDLTAGGVWGLTDNLALDLGYRYFHFGDITTGQYRVAGPGGGTAQAYSSRTALHEVMLGLRFSH